MEYERDYSLPTIQPGMLFGQLGALNVLQARHSTVTAEVDSKVLVLRSEKIWEAVNGFSDDVLRMTAESESWAAFMASEIALMCHPQIAYQLRGVATVKTVVEGEEHQLSVSNQKRQTWAAAIIERGQAVVKETGEVLKPKDTVNAAAMLGMNRSSTVMSHGGKACQIAMLDRWCSGIWCGIFQRPRRSTLDGLCCSCLLRRLKSHKFRCCNTWKAHTPSSEHWQEVFVSESHHQEQLQSWPRTRSKR